MLDSLLNCSKRVIRLDHLVVKDSYDDQILLTDPDAIKQATIHHFQNVAGSLHTSKDHIVEWAHWQPEYAPRAYIDSSIYSQFLDLPSLSEWLDIIHQLPNNKAPGPFHISNEMLKHLGPSIQHKLWLLIKAILILNDIPDQWKEAYLYPIPKPKEWHYDINNTRLITLLDTVCKAVVKFMTNHLIKIFTQNKVLQSYNFAALPHSFTFKPLYIIDNILYDVKQHDHKVWLLFQNMSKAYDRINIFILQKAMLRLNIPSPFITFITNLFTNRTNQIFTYYGTTDPYNILVGIN